MHLNLHLHLHLACDRIANYRVGYLDNVTVYSAKLRNPTQVATMITALDLGVF
jgi:hypothetical protein